MTQNEEEFLKALSCLSRKYGIIIKGTYDGAELFPIETTKLSDESGYGICESTSSSFLDWYYI